MSQASALGLSRAMRAWRTRQDSETPVPRRRPYFLGVWTPFSATGRCLAWFCPSAVPSADDDFVHSSLGVYEFTLLFFSPGRNSLRDIRIHLGITPRISPIRALQIGGAVHGPSYETLLLRRSMGSTWFAARTCAARTAPGRMRSTPCRRRSRPSTRPKRNKSTTTKYNNINEYIQTNTQTNKPFTRSPPRRDDDHHFLPDREKLEDI